MAKPFLNQNYVVDEENVEAIATLIGMNVDLLRRQLEAANMCDSYYIVHVKHTMTPKKPSVWNP